MAARSSLAGCSGRSSPLQAPLRGSSLNRSADGGGAAAAGSVRLAVKSMLTGVAVDDGRSTSWTLSASSIALSASSVGSLDFGMFAIAVVASPLTRYCWRNPFTMSAGRATSA